MATTRLFAMHVHKNKSIRQCLDDTTHYIMNPSKTKDGALVKTFGCNPHTVDAPLPRLRAVYVEPRKAVHHPRRLGYGHVERSRPLPRGGFPRYPRVQ